MGSSADANAAHAEGLNTSATGGGVASHVGGEGSSAVGRASFAHGYSVHITGGSYNIVMGYNATNAYTRSFVWNGDTAPYKPMRGVGTFCINPQQGAAGVYIGSSNLLEIIRAEIRAAAGN
jgi:hypothetical protein